MYCSAFSPVGGAPVPSIDHDRWSDEVATLAARARLGDKQAAEQLLGCYLPLLATLVARNAAVRVTGVLSETDLWQEAYRLFFELLHSFQDRPPEAFGTYLKDMIGWRLANYVRAERRRQARSEGLASQHLDLLIAQPPRNLAGGLRNPRLRAACRKLSPRQRAVLFHIYWKDKEVAEVATDLGLTPQAVTGLRRRAEERLRAELQEEKQP